MACAARPGGCGGAGWGGGEARGLFPPPVHPPAGSTGALRPCCCPPVVGGERRLSFSLLFFFGRGPCSRPPTGDYRRHAAFALHILRGARMVCLRVGGGGSGRGGGWCCGAFPPLPALLHVSPLPWALPPLFSPSHPPPPLPFCPSVMPVGCAGGESLRGARPLLFGGECPRVRPRAGPLPVRTLVVFGRLCCLLLPSAERSRPFFFLQKKLGPAV